MKDATMIHIGYPQLQTILWMLNMLGHLSSNDSEHRSWHICFFSHTSPQKLKVACFLKETSIQETYYPDYIRQTVSVRYEIWAEIACVDVIRKEK